MARGERLAHDAGIEDGYGFVGHGLQALVALVEDLVGVLAQRGVRLVADDDADLALVNDRVKFGLDLGVEHFADVAELEAGLEISLADTDADHVALAGVHEALHAVEEGVDLTLEDRLEVGLHILACDLDGVAHGDLGADRDLVDFGAFDHDLVILDLGGVLRGDELEAVLAGAVDLDLHVALTDDLALECRGEGDGDVDLGDLQLDAARLDGGVDPVLGVIIDDEGLRNGPHIVVVVGDDREAQLDGAGAAGDGNVVDRLISVDKRVDAVEGVLVEALDVARLDGAEDHGCAHDQRNDVADGPDLFADGNDTDREAHGKTGFHSLLDDAADQEDENAAGLIALDGLDRFLGGRSRADHDDEAGDIAGNKRNAEFTDFCVGEVAVIVRALIRGLGLDIFAGLDHLSGDGGADAGLEDRVGARLAEHHGLHVGQSILQFAGRSDLFADIGIDAGAEIRGGGKRQRSVAADFSHDLVHFFLGLGEHLVRAVEDAVKQCLHCGFIPFRFILWRQWQP